MAEPLSDLEALEAFVVDNDDLAAIESRVGRFNLFDALGVVNRELSHSNFLAWLLDPAESHGLGGLFLRAFLMDLLRQTPRDQRLFSPIALDGGELHGIEVRREWKSIDLLITAEEPAFVLAIENKIHSGEHSDQLSRYRRVVEGDAQLAGTPARQFVFLTPEGDAPSEDDWTVYSYTQLHAVLIRVRNANASLIGGDVRVFLDHYLRLLQTRLMTDETLEATCREIYKNHRQAIDLIVEHGKVKAPGMAEVRQWLMDASDWTVSPSGKLGLKIEPVSWSAEDVPRRLKPGGQEVPWIRLHLQWHENFFYFFGQVRACEDEQLRHRVIAGLKAEAAVYGFNRSAKVLKGSCQIYPEDRLVLYSSPAEADPDAILAAVQKLLRGKLAPLHDLPDLLKRLVDAG